MYDEFHVLANINVCNSYANGGIEIIDQFTISENLKRSVLGHIVIRLICIYKQANEYHQCYINKFSSGRRKTNDDRIVESERKVKIHITAVYVIISVLQDRCFKMVSECTIIT